MGKQPLTVRSSCDRSADDLEAYTHVYRWAQAIPCLAPFPRTFRCQILEKMSRPYGAPEPSG